MRILEGNRRKRMVYDSSEYSYGAQQHLLCYVDKYTSVDSLGIAVIWWNNDRELYQKPCKVTRWWAKRVKAPPRPNLFVVKGIPTSSTPATSHQLQPLPNVYPQHPPFPIQYHKMKDPFAFLCIPRLTLQTNPLASTLSLATLPSHAHEILYSFTLYTLLSSYISPFLSRRLFPRTYPALSGRQKVNWDIHVTSFVQSIVVCALAGYVILGDQQRMEMDWRGRIWGYTGAMGSVEGAAMGYFLWDLLVSVRYFDISGGSALFHAISALLVTGLGFVSLPFLSPVLLVILCVTWESESTCYYTSYEGTECWLIFLFEQRPFANYYGLNFILYELSTPFLNIHWFLDKLNLTGSTLQLVNAAFLLTTFFSARCVWGTYQSYYIYQDLWKALTISDVERPLAVAAGMAQGQVYDVLMGGGVGDGSVPWWLAGLYAGSNSVLSLLQFYWFGKMVQAVRKRFDGGEEAKKEGGKEIKKRRWINRCDLNSAMEFAVLGFRMYIYY